METLFFFVIIFIFIACFVHRLYKDNQDFFEDNFNQDWEKR
jgi:hypothetical protein